jgi:hypothetical protein
MRLLPFPRSANKTLPRFAQGQALLMLLFSPEDRESIVFFRNVGIYPQVDVALKFRSETSTVQYNSHVHSHLPQALSYVLAKFLCRYGEEGEVSKHLFTELLNSV